VAKQENLTAFKNFWPLGFLGLPFVYAVHTSFGSGEFPQPVASILWLALLGWVGYAISLLVRRAPGNIPRAVVSFIAGFCLLYGLLVALQGESSLALVAVVFFGLTVVLQRYVRGT